MSVDAESSEEFIAIGKISGVYGVKGWVKVFSYTDPRENITQYSPWYAKKQGQWQRCEVISKRQGKHVIAQIDGCNDRDIAFAMMSTELAIQKKQLDTLSEGEYYWRDLEGLRVMNTEGIEFGCVDHLLETGANDVLVVRDEDHERLIPLTLGHSVVRIDLEARLIEVEWDADF